MSTRRVVVTGIGITSALGATREETWSAMLEGRCGVRPVTAFDVSGFRSQVAAEVDMPPVRERLSRWQRRRLSRADQIGLVAAEEAIADAGLPDAGIAPHRIGVMLGAGTADLIRNEEYFFTTLTDGIERARPSKAWNHFANTPGDAIAEAYGFEGARTCIAAACSSSTIAIGQAVDAIRLGRLDAVVTGATDALARLTFSGFNALRLMDPAPCRPFDRHRAGMNIGEGAAMLIVEDFDQATRRAARIYAEIAGYGLACEAFHPTAPHPDGVPVAAVIRQALADARVDASTVDHINAHATATPQNDRAEARGFRAVFGNRVGEVPVTATKSMIGHCLGAAGALEAATVALTIARGVIPPSINHHDTDPECALDVVANTPRQKRVRCAVSTSLAFGGNDAALVLRAV